MQLWVNFKKNERNFNYFIIIIISEFKFYHQYCEICVRKLLPKKVRKKTFIISGINTLTANY